MRCDLHVHTTHSGMCTEPLLRFISRESYNDPQALYDVLKQRGMDLVTVTDHDSIDAAESLRRHPDFFLSEETTCTAPSGTLLRVGVFDIQDTHHIELPRRRTDLPRFLAYLNEQNVLFSANHVFSSLTGRRAAADFDLFSKHFAAFETRNGQLHRSSNRVWSKKSRDSRLKLEQAAEPITAANGPALRQYVRRGEQEEIALALMVPVKMMMGDVLVQRQA